MCPSLTKWSVEGCSHSDQWHSLEQTHRIQSNQLPLQFLCSPHGGSTQPDATGTRDHLIWTIAASFDFVSTTAMHQRAGRLCSAHASESSRRAVRHTARSTQQRNSGGSRVRLTSQEKEPPCCLVLLLASSQMAHHS